MTKYIPQKIAILRSRNFSHFSQIH